MRTCPKGGKSNNNTVGYPTNLADHCAPGDGGGGDKGGGSINIENMGETVLSNTLCYSFKFKPKIQIKTRS